MLTQEQEDDTIQSFKFQYHLLLLPVVGFSSQKVIIETKHDTHLFRQ